MDKSIFASKYSNVIARDYNGKEKKIKQLLNFGGKDKLQKTLNDDEEILAVSYAMSVDDPMAVSVFMSDDVLVITNIRFIYLQSRLFGTIIKEIPLNMVKSIVWSGKGNTLQLGTFKSEVNMVINQDGLSKIKETIYEMQLCQ